MLAEVKYRKGPEERKIQTLLQDITTEEREVKQTGEACESKVLRFLKNQWHLGPERWLGFRKFVALAEPPGLIPRTNMTAHNLL